MVVKAKLLNKPEMVIVDKYDEFSEAEGCERKLTEYAERNEAGQNPAKKVADGRLVQAVSFQLIKPNQFAMAGIEVGCGLNNVKGVQR